MQVYHFVCCLFGVFFPVLAIVINGTAKAAPELATG
jgi:hypothetical protein